MKLSDSSPSTTLISTFIIWDLMSNVAIQHSLRIIAKELLKIANELSEIALENPPSSEDILLLYRLSPKHSAASQMIRRGYTTEQIAGRLGTTHNGAKTIVRYLLHKIGFTHKKHFAAYLDSIWHKLDPKVYLERTGIPIDWLSIVEHIPFDQVQKKDPYYSKITKRHRSATSTLDPH